MSDDKPGNSIEWTDEEKKELYGVEMKEPKGEPPGLTYFSQIWGAIKERFNNE